MSVGYADLGGMEGPLQAVRELVEYPLTHPEIFAHLGTPEPPRSLPVGPPGCGKTLLACAIAGELGVGFVRVSAPEVVSGMSGESEAKIRQLFREAREAAPALLFIDEIDAIAPKREAAQREMEKRIVAQMLTCMDELAAAGGSQFDSADQAASSAAADASAAAAPLAPPPPPPTVIVIGATNRPDSLDPALRRAGRFDREIALGIPDAAARGRILKVMARNMRLAPDVDVESLGRRCNGFVGADLAALCKEAAVVAVNRIFGSLLAAAPPGGAAGGAATSEEGSGGDGHLGRRLTLLAKAVANESGASFMSVSGPELLNKYVGESERAVRVLFARGRASAPCVIFFDELDALVPRRGGEAGSQATERVVNQLLTEMDGLENRAAVYVVAATNRPDIIDPAMLRPGRLDKLLYVPLPPPGARADILRAAARRTPLAPDVDLEAVARDPRSDGLSGADLAHLVREAATNALRDLRAAESGGGGGGGAGGEGGGEGGGVGVQVQRAHFERALDTVRPSVSAKDEARYKQLASRLRKRRAEGGSSERPGGGTPSAAPAGGAAAEGGEPAAEGECI
uniref:AAA+ ATPase domain-containing protein n=2 Tax=Emiliania huxleyi TaxID=2903 RepID=A0A0D3J5E7_EMIH1